MSVFRIYTDKTNTIASGIYQDYNSSQNSIADLWRGGSNSVPFRNSISRHLMYFDLENLKNKFSSGEIMSGNVTSYVLKMKNAIPRGSVLNDEFDFDVLQKRISTSFHLICFPINKFFSSGLEYDLAPIPSLIRQIGNPPQTGVSNWNSATSVINWDEPGVFTNPATAVTFPLPTQYFDGFEDMSMDITELVNYWIVSGNTNYGLGIAYRHDYELLSGDTRDIASFMTSKTNSSYKPYVEVTYNQTIRDDRNQVSNNRVSRLFLYTFSGGNTANFYSSSTVSIVNGSNTVIQSGLVPQQFSKGVYYIDILMSSATKGQIYYDVWNDVTFVPGIDKQTFRQKFSITDNFYFSKPSINDYTVNIYGLDNNKIITGDELIRVFVICRVNYSQFEPSPDLNINYKMIMNNQDEVVPWTPVHMTTKNGCQEFYFDVDASWLLTNQAYKIYLRIDEMGSQRVLPQDISFRVIKKF